MSPRALGSHVLKRRFCPTKTGIHWVETGNSCSTSTPELPGWDTHFGHPAEPSNSFMAVLQLQVSHLVPFPSLYNPIYTFPRNMKVGRITVCNPLGLQVPPQTPWSPRNHVIHLTFKSFVLSARLITSSFGWPRCGASRPAWVHTVQRHRPAPGGQWEGMRAHPAEPAEKFGHFDQ